MSSFKKLWLVAVCAAMLSGLEAQADSITFETPPGSTLPSTSGPMIGTGFPVNASATITPSAGVIMITLINMQANPVNDIQTLANVDFTLSNPISGMVGFFPGNNNCCNAPEISVGPPMGTITPEGMITNGNQLGWALTSPGPSEIRLDSVGASNAPHIIGPPDNMGFYSNADITIANGSDFYDREVLWMLSAPGVTADTTITSVTFSFGAGDAPVEGIPAGTSVPEPGTLVMIGVGLICLFGLRGRRHATAN